MTIKPMVEATFVLDRDGHPKSIGTGDLRHYKIRVRIADPPEDAYAVTYELDPSYYDPLREARNRKKAFEEEITSYGDFIVEARVRGKSRALPLSTKLSDALARGHRSSLTPEVRKALEEIRSK